MDQYRMVKGTVDELEALLNQAFADGFTVIMREFPPPYPGVAMVSESALPPEPEPVFRFMMTRPVSPLGSFDTKSFVQAFREMATMLGFGDRLPPEPEGAKIRPIRAVAPAEEHGQKTIEGTGSERTDPSPGK